MEHSRKQTSLWLLAALLPIAIFMILLGAGIFIQARSSSNQSSGTNRSPNEVLVGTNNLKDPVPAATPATTNNTSKLENCQANPAEVVSPIDIKILANSALQELKIPSNYVRIAWNATYEQLAYTLPDKNRTSVYLCDLVSGSNKLFKNLKYYPAKDSNSPAQIIYSPDSKYLLVSDGAQQILSVSNGSVVLLENDRERNFSWSWLESGSLLRKVSNDPEGKTLPEFFKIGSDNRMEKITLPNGIDATSYIGMVGEVILFQLPEPIGFNLVKNVTVQIGVDNLSLNYAQDGLFTAFDNQDNFHIYQFSEDKLTPVIKKHINYSVSPRFLDRTIKLFIDQKPQLAMSEGGVFNLDTGTYKSWPDFWKSVSNDSDMLYRDMTDITSRWLSSSKGIIFGGYADEDQQNYTSYRYLLQWPDLKLQKFTTD